MLAAIKEAGRSLKAIDGGPFGACIVKEGKIIARGRNRVLKKDATCHAEIEAIRRASKLLGTFDLSGCEVYSTTEPCPMCFSALHWARVDKVIFGTSIKEAKRAGFNELPISCKEMKRLGRAKIKIKAGFMLGECESLFERWRKLKNRKTY
ncbi:MAG: nucleoside deaminase [Candidatus Omnitrophica bacterium]|nr:nucleoside deaminase [Candidatus Omnitrophota bacterium]